jgi:hypothetical protein
MVCALAAETKEAEYLAMVERHKSGNAGKRGVELMGQMFGELVASMDKTDADVLGDLFQGAITYGEAGQYFTPESVTKLLAQMSIDPDARPENGKPILINDPCCGTGRMLLEAANINPRAELVGQDIDARCARITAINLGLRGRYGWVVCGNSLSGETKFAYRVGSFFNETPSGLRRGVIRDVPAEATLVPAFASRIQEQSRALFGEETLPDAPESTPAMTIIEVPQWLARLEAKLATSEGERPPVAAPEASQSTSEPAQPAESEPARTDQPAETRSDDRKRHTQRELF